MRIGLFSDTHGNLAALKVVLARLKQEGCELLVCLGDTVGYGPFPNECCELVRDVAGHVVKGNHDAAVAGDMDYSFYYGAARKALDHHREILTAENLAWLQEIPQDARGPGDTYFCHGSPVDLEEYEYVFTVEQASQCLDVWDRLGRITFVGHSHLCKAFAVSDNHQRAFEVVTRDFVLRPGFRYIVSAGSVGQPRDRDSRAACIVYDTQEATCRFVRVEYPIDETAKAIFANPRLADNFGTRLFAGV